MFGKKKLNMNFTIYLAKKAEKESRDIVQLFFNLDDSQG